MKHLLSLALLPVIASLFTSCGALGTQTAGVEGISLPTPDPAKQEAIVCFSRDLNFQGGGVVLDFYVDDQRVASLPVKSWSYVFVEPGHHTVHHRYKDTKLSKERSFHISSGEIKSFNYSSPFFGSRALREVPEATGRRLIRSRKFTTINE